MANAWFESVAEAQRRAKKRLPKGVYGALVAGSERGLTVDDNIAAFAELGFAPHTAGLANDKQMAIRVMGQDVSLPVRISPAGGCPPPAPPPGGERRGGWRPGQASRWRRSSRPTRRPSSSCTGSATAT